MNKKTEKTILRGRISTYEELAKRRELTDDEDHELRVAKEKLHSISPKRKDGINRNYQYAYDSKTPKRSEVRGNFGEVVPVGKMESWHKRAVANGHFRNQGTDRDWNRAMGEMCGFAQPSVETRTLLEDVSGSGQALSINQYLPKVIDVLLPQTILGKLNFNTVPMDRELVQMPVYTSTYAGPNWIAENGSLALDAGPAFAPLQLMAPGGWKFYTSITLELAQDAFLQGTLDQWLAQAAAKKLAVALDTSAFAGVTGNVGVPGLWNESGFVVRHFTSDSGTSGFTPVDTQELAVAAGISFKKYVPVEQLSFVSNFGTHEAFLRIPAATYAKYWDTPPIVADNPYVVSENSVLAYTETDPSTASGVAQTGGSYSSLYCGPWSRFGYLGIRLDLNSSLMRLDQRLIDQGQIGFFSMFRGSIRYAHPETFSRTIGIITK